MIAIEVILSIAEILSMLSSLQAPISCESTYSIISQMQYPSSMQIQALNYPPQLKTIVIGAWQHAYLAKQTASRINNWGLCYFINNPPMKMSPGFYQLFSIFLDKFSGAKTNYYQAIAFSSQAYSFEIKQAEQDYIKMDEIGFDKLDEGFEKNQFEKTKQLLLSPQNPLLQSNVYSMKAEQETLLQILKASGLKAGVNFYNELLGKKQGLLLFEQNHKQTKKLISNYDKKFHEEDSSFTAKKKQLQEKISYLRSQGVLGINQAFEKNSIPLASNISFTDSSSPSRQLLELKQQEQSITKKEADYIYASKEEDYLVNAFQLLNNQTIHLSELSQQADSLTSELNSIKQQMQQECLQGLEKLSPESSFYNQAFEKCNYEGTLKQSIENYNEAIRIEQGDYSNYDYLIQYISDSISQLQLLGLNMNQEEKQLSNLKQSKASLQSKYSSLIKLKNQVESRGKIFKKEFNQNAIQLTDYFSIVKGSSIFYVNSNELKNDEQQEELMESQEFYPNAYTFIKNQENLVNKYSELISSNAGNYFKQRIHYNFFFSAIPSCNQKTRTTEEISLLNNLADLTDLKINANVSSKKTELVIPFFKKNSFYSASFNFTSTPLVCSSQEKQQQGNYFIAEIKAIPSMPLKKARVKFNLPANVSIISSSGLLINSSVYLTNLNEPQEVVVIYKPNEGNAVTNNSFIINDSALVNNSFFTPFNSTEFNKQLELNLSSKITSINNSNNASAAFGSRESDSTFNLTELNALLFAYQKAVDDEVMLKHGKIKSNYSYYKKKVSALTGLSVGEFNQESSTIKLSLKQEINSRKKQAEEEYNSVAALGSNEYLQRAKYWFDKGYYTRSYLYSQFALKLMNSRNPNWAFAAAFVIIAFASYLVLKKQDKQTEKKIERKLYSFD